MSGDCLKVACAWVLSVASWMTPQPIHSSGYLVNYGSRELIEDQATYRHYDLSLYPDRCGISLISPVHLGQVVWVRVRGGRWHGPCLSVDSMAQRDAYRGIYLNHEIAELPRWLATKLGFENGAQGELWIGLCPPPLNGWGEAEIYEPPLSFYQGERRPLFWPFAPQQRPGTCRGNIQ